MRFILRRLLGLPEFRLTKDDALRAAMDEAESREWRWGEPVLVRETLRTYQVWTNAQSRGGNVSIEVAGSDGRIVSARLIRR